MAPGGTAYSRRTMVAPLTTSKTPAALLAKADYLAGDYWRIGALRGTPTIRGFINDPDLPVTALLETLSGSRAAWRPRRHTLSVAQFCWAGSVK